MSAVPSEHAWRARLRLGFTDCDGPTRLTEREHYGPLLVQRPFYPEGPDGPCHVYIIHPPGGVVSGDELHLDVSVGRRAHALLTTPAAGKFYRRRDQRVASLTQTLSVDDGTLEWLPQENIYYPQSVARVCTGVRLRGAAARFVGWEVSCFGLPANDVSLGSGEVRQSFELWHDGRPVLLERVRIDETVLAARWGLAGEVASGTLLLYPATREHLEQARAVAGERVACTLVDDALCCRGIAARVDRLKQVLTDLWTALRPGLIGRAASPPRIWLT